jgi:hypothetical protein
MPFFNSAKDIHSFIDQDINLRISCHAGMAHYTKKSTRICMATPSTIFSSMNAS